MKRSDRSAKRFSVPAAFLMASLVAATVLPLAAQNPPQADPIDPHRVLYKGQPTVLAGYYPGIQALIVSPQVNASNPTASTYYKSLIDTLTDTANNNHINLLRVTLTMGMALENRPWLHPYQRWTSNNCNPTTGTWCTNHAAELQIAGNRFNLNSWNEPFFAYWDAVLAYAEARNLIVQVTFFDGAHMRLWKDIHDTDPASPPFERLGRVYDYFEGGNNASGLDIKDITAWHTNAQALDRQRLFVEKAVQRLGDHNNVIWEIMNESQVTRPSPANPSGGHAWFATMRGYIQAAEQLAGHQAHMIMPYDSPDHQEVSGHWTPGRDNLDSHYQSTHTGLITNFNQYSSPILADNDCCSTPGTPTQLRKKAWTSLVTGAHPSMLVYNVTGSTSPTGLGLTAQGAPIPTHSTQQGIRYVGFVRKFINDRQIDLRGMNPRDDLIANASPAGYIWCLASEAERYIVYFYNPGSATVLGLPSSFQSWWFNTVTGAFTTGPSSGSFFQTPSPAQDWALYIAAPQELRTNVIADAYVAEETAGTNYGTSTDLQTRLAPTDQGRFSFLKFSVPSFSGSVVSAKLRIRTQETTVSSVAAYKMNNMAWSESQIKWNNWDQNGAVTFTYLSTTNSLAPNTWYDLDVTAAVTGAGIINLGLASAHDIENQDFWSRESAYPPQLQILRSSTPTLLLVNPSADSWVSENQPTTNFGSQTELRVRWDPTHFGRHSFLRFTVPQYTGTLVSAKLRIRTNSTQVPTAALYSVNNMGSWNENTINWLNWDNQGLVTFTFLSTTGVLAANTWHEIDVTTAVTGPGTTLNLGIASSADVANLRFWSRQSGFIPELIVTYNP